MNKPNFWAIIFIQFLFPGPIIRLPDVSPQPLFYADVNGISAKSKQVNCFTFLSPLQMRKF